MSLKVVVLYYSRFGHTKAIAEYIAEGVMRAPGVEAVLRTVPSVSPTTEQTEASIPDVGAVFATPEDIKSAAGLAIGSPTRFGNMAAPMKYFIDTLSGVWMQNGFVGKPFSVFTGSSAMHGGQESTLITMALPFLHLGGLWMSLPFSEALKETTTGGTPYGVSHYAGPKSDRPIDQNEKSLAIEQGERLAKIAKKLA